MGPNELALKIDQTQPEEICFLLSSPEDAPEYLLQLIPKERTMGRVSNKLSSSVSRVSFLHMRHSFEQTDEFQSPFSAKALLCVGFDTSSFHLNVQQFVGSTRGSLHVHEEILEYKSAYDLSLDRDEQSIHDNRHYLLIQFTSFVVKTIGKRHPIVVLLSTLHSKWVQSPPHHVSQLHKELHSRVLHSHVQKSQFGIVHLQVGFEFQVGISQQNHIRPNTTSIVLNVVCLCRLGKAM
jgi:hypothetical protein